MPDQVQLRGGSKEENDGFVGADREVTVDTSSHTLRVHDGSTTGGHPLATGTSSTDPEPDTLVQRDAWGRAQVTDPVDDADVANKSYVDGQIGDSVRAITADDENELTWHEGDLQAVSGSSYHTIFDIDDPVQLLGGAIYSQITGFRLTVDGVVVANRTAGTRARESALDQFSVVVVPAATAATSMKLELWNQSSNSRDFGWRVVTR